MVKILFLVRRFYPHIGGVEKHVLKISQVFIKRGYTVTVVTELQGDLPLYEVRDGIEIYRFNPGKHDWYKKFRIWKWFFDNRHLIKAADIIHCHDVFFWYLPFRFLYAQKKSFITFHGYETRFPVQKKAIIIRKVSELLARGNICVGEYIKKWYHTKPDYVVYGAVDTHIEQKEIPHKKLAISFLGRIEKDNGIEIYAKALEKLKKEAFPFTFMAYGDGSLRNVFEQIGDVTGFTQVHLQNTDIVFASSYLSILEAMVQKKLVIATYTNDLKKDYLQMAPFASYIYITNNKDDLSSYLISFNRTPSIVDKITKAYEYAKTQTWEHLADIYTQLWNK